MTSITSYSGSFYFLSNNYPCRILYEFEEYGSVAHAYESAKTLDKNYRIMIAKAETVTKAKRIGHVAPRRQDWEQVRLPIMRQLLCNKFSNHRLRKALLHTKPYMLIEGNWWGDDYWGVDMQGRGNNWLGRLLMEIRDEQL